MYSWDYLDLIDNESRRKRLLKLVSLRLVLNNKSVKVARTSNLKLDRIRVLLNASGFGVLSAGNFEKFLDILDLLRHRATSVLQF
jgi:hypothetical protein